MLKEGNKAPDILLNDKDNNKVKLSEIKGKKIVYFYSKDNTSGCSKQAQGFAQCYAELKSYGIEVIGISKDSTESHKKFSEKYSLPFILLSDNELAAIKAYDVLAEKNVSGEIKLKTVRTTYLINEEGIIEKVWEKVKASENPYEVLEYVKK